MMRISKHVIPFLLMLMFISCATGPRPIPTTEIPVWALSEESPNQILRNNVELEIEIISPLDEESHDDLFRFSLDDVSDLGLPNTFMYYNKASDGFCRCYTFGTGTDHYFSAFMVTFTNNTDHILRMEGSRIYLIPDNGEPVKALGEIGNSTLVKPSEKASPLPSGYLDRDGSLVDWATRMEAGFEGARKKGILSFQYPVGLASQVIRMNRENYNLANNAESEILPGFSYSGLLVFPVSIKDNVNATLAFYDIVTKTDMAGNIVEKTKFEFPLDRKIVKLWYDTESKEWNEGEPPQPTIDGQ